MNGSTSILPSRMQPMPWPSRTRSFSLHRSRAHAPASKPVASTSLPSTAPNSKKPNPASPAPVLFSQTQLPPDNEPAHMKCYFARVRVFSTGQLILTKELLSWTKEKSVEGSDRPPAAPPPPSPLLRLLRDSPSLPSLPVLFCLS